jgi:uncharacterized protein (TIGR00369 family)
MEMNVELGFAELVTEGPFQGWRGWGGADPYETHAGPFFYTQDETGAIRCAFIAEHRHLNIGGIVHGGCLMSFADMALFAVAFGELGAFKGVTVSLNAEFTNAANLGDTLEATGEVVRAGGSIVFVRGQIRASPDQRVVLSYSGIIKRFRERG